MNLHEEISRIRKVMGLNESIFDWFKSQKDSDDFTKSEEERFTCQDCGDPNYNMYMVNDDIWKKYGNKYDTLCMDCLEKRMGRNLTKDDFSQHKDALVNIYNKKVSEIIKR